MLVVKEVNTFWWPVTGNQPSEEKPGETEKFEFQILVAAIKRSRLREIEEEARACKDHWEAEEKLDNFLRETIIGWNDIEDENGKEIEFTLNNLDQLLEMVWLRTALRNAVFEALRGEAQVKN